MKIVYSAVRTGSLNKAVWASSLNGETSSGYHTEAQQIQTPYIQTFKAYWLRDAPTV
jgi:hypothetical protein